MTNRVDALTVVLTDGIREDDVEQLVNAIHQLRGVLQVNNHIVRNVDSRIAEARVKDELRTKLLSILDI